MARHCGDVPWLWRVTRAMPAGRYTGDTSRVMRMHMYGAMYSDMRAGSRDMSDPWARGRERSPGRRGGSLTSRLRHKPGFPAGTARRPVGAASARLRRSITLYRKRLALRPQPRNRDFTDACPASMLAGPRKNTPSVFFPLFFRG
jgi:hypothetical protein